MTKTKSTKAKKTIKTDAKIITLTYNNGHFNVAKENCSIMDCLSILTIATSLVIEKAKK